MIIRSKYVRIRSTVPVITLDGALVLQLKERDAKGFTPFMTAIQCHNIKAALYILDFVEKHRGKESRFVLQNATCLICF